MKTTLWWTQMLLFACASLMLGYWAFTTADSWWFQRAESRQLEALGPVAAEVALTETGLPTGVDGLIGRIEIPRLDLSAIVMEGTGAGTLHRAAGHIAGTSLPGRAGNFGIAAHRDTFFRPLRNIRASDVILIRTRAAEYRYRVVSTKIVDPGAVEVLSQGAGESLTLVTCYPFYFVGPSPNRFIVRAERVI